MKRIFLSLLAISAIFQSCTDNDDEIINVVAPATYQFDRNGNTSVNFSGQTTRIKMGDELASALLVPTKTITNLNGMFAHTPNAINFSDVNLNASDKNIRSKVAASTDYFSANTTNANAIKADFDRWIQSQVTDVFPKWNSNAAVGIAGRIQEGGGGPMRWVNGKGLEYDQAIVKGLIGGLMVDQILNNYLSAAVLDAGKNREDNSNNVLVAGQNYTDMEHKWDEAFGYMYGNEPDITKPVLNTDQYLNKYLNRVRNDTDFSSMDEDIYDAFKLGRAAIVAKNYDLRDAQIQILKEKISEIIGIRSVYYLQVAKLTLANDKGSAFHDLSEGFGFIYSLQFTRKPGSNESYFTKAEVDAFIATLTTGNGFWDITTTTLDAMSNTIAAKFKFTVAQAGS